VATVGWYFFSFLNVFIRDLGCLFLKHRERMGVFTVRSDLVRLLYRELLHGLRISLAFSSILSFSRQLKDINHRSYVQCPVCSRPPCVLPGEILKPHTLHS
jgi:hypothetical protein